MSLSLTNKQLQKLSKRYGYAAINEGCSLEKYMDWIGLDMIDKFVEANIGREIDVENWDEMDSLNAVYDFAREFITKQHTYQ